MMLTFVERVRLEQHEREITQRHGRELPDIRPGRRPRRWERPADAVVTKITVQAEFSFTPPDNGVRCGWGRDEDGVWRWVG